MNLQKKILIGVGAVLLLMTATVFLYENYFYSGDLQIAGKLLYSRNLNPALCCIQLTDQSRVTIPLSGVTQEQLDYFKGKDVVIHYSQTSIGKCRLLGIDEVT